MLVLSETQMEVARLLEQLSLADRFFLSSFSSHLSFFSSHVFSTFSLLSSLLVSFLYSLLSSLFSSLSYLFAFEMLGL